MAAKESLHCQVITPERQVLDADADAVVLPAHDGQIGILKNRAPLLCALGTGVLRVDVHNEGGRHFSVEGGFAQVLNNEVTILTERADAAEEITRANAQKLLADAEKMPASDATMIAARDKAIRRAKVQLQIATK
jgi:F-type H+-transporting ATPase subunit epsilon